LPGVRGKPQELGPHKLLARLPKELEHVVQR
jgi:hypothetical protein